MIKLSAIALIILFLTLQGCKKEEPVLSPKIAQLIGTWQLVDPASSYDVTLKFALDTANPPNDVTAFKASGKSAVNTYNVFLSAAVDGLMVVVNLDNSEVAGSQAESQYDQAYFNSLRAIVRYELTDTNHLQLFHAGSKPGVLNYERIQ